MSNASSPNKKPAAAKSPSKKASDEKENGEVSVASTTVTSSPSTSGSSDTSAAAAVGKKKSGAVRKRNLNRPTSGGLSIGFSAEELAAQAQKRKAWMQAEVEERVQLRKAVKAENDKQSDSALRIVLIVWCAVIVAIFWHVYQTIQRGLDRMADEDPQYDIPASESLLKAFRTEAGQFQ